jgi:hypothetical protein
LAGNFPARFPVKVENALGVLVKSFTRFGEKYPTTIPFK